MDGRDGRRLLVAATAATAPTSIVPVVNIRALVAELGTPPADTSDTFDFKPLSAEAREAVEALNEACRKGSGGLIVVGHGYDAELKAALAAVCAFHAAKREFKDGLNSEQPYYDAPGGSKIAIRPTSLHERFAYPRVRYAGDGTDALDDIAGGGVQPIDERDPPLFDRAPCCGLDAAMRDYQRAVRTIILALLRAMAIKLDLPRRHFDAGWARSNSGLHSLHYLTLLNEGAATSDGFSGRSVYPGFERAPAESRVGTGEDAPVTAGRMATHDGIGDLGAACRAYPHSDGDTMLTLLCHDSIEGLQVLLRGAEPRLDEWVDVPRVAETQIVVQIGQMTQRWTNDEYKATPHRVLRPAAPAPSRTTLSIFFRPGLETPLEVPPCLRRPNDAGGIYDTVSCAEFLHLPRTDGEGRAVKITSNVLKDGRWVGARPGSHAVPNVF